MIFGGFVGRHFLQTPQVFPSFAHRLQYLQFLQALQGFAPTQVAKLLVMFLAGLGSDALAVRTNAPNERRINFFMIGFGVRLLTVINTGDTYHTYIGRPIYTT